MVNSFDPFLTISCVNSSFWVDILVKIDAVGHRFDMENTKDIVEGTSEENIVLSMHINPCRLFKYGPLTSLIPQFFFKNNLSFEGAVYLMER